MIDSKKWSIIYLISVAVILGYIAFSVYKTDPWFHYRKPDISGHYYGLDPAHERFQNDGILKHFDYQGIITGSSMCENFKTSEADDFWGYSFVKTPFSGATFYEINRNLESATKNNRNIKIIIRGLDRGKFMEESEGLRTDLGDYPEYLYDENPFNDVKYLFNRDILFGDLYYSAFVYSKDKRGIISFDEYANWMAGETEFGVNKLYPDGIYPTDYEREQGTLTEEEKELIISNTRQNITQLAKDNPDITFCYFFTPYSGVWYQQQINKGDFKKHIETLRIVTEEMLQCENIKLYSFDNLTDMINDLNNYVDPCHYAEWVNSMMLEFMKEDKCLLTASNYKEFIDNIEAFYGSFDYEGFYGDQEIYDDIQYTKSVFESELTPKW